MKVGTLEERHLKSAVLKYLKKSDNVSVGPGVGLDYALTGSMVTTSGYGECPSVAWNKALNNFLCSMGVCQFARIQMLLPGQVKQSQVSGYMKQFTDLAKEAGVQILGGNTVVTENVSKACFTVELLGECHETYHLDRKKVQVGDDIVLAGAVGILGTNLLLEQEKEKLTERFQESFLKQASYQEEELSVAKTVDVLYQESGVLYLHDVSDGGVYTALWQLGECLQKGFLVDNRKLVINQGTIEICEFLDRNPYLLDGTGALLLVCRNGNRLVSRLQESGLTAKVVGEITENKERRVLFAENEIRTLSAEG